MGEAGGPGRDEGVDQAGQEVEGVAREGHQEEGGPGGEEALGGEGGVVHTWEVREGCTPAQ